MNDEMKTSLSTDQNGAPKLQPGFGKMSIFAFSIGTSIGWGSLVVTCNSYLAQLSL